MQQCGIRKRPKAVRVAEMKAIFQSFGTNLAAFTNAFFDSKAAAIWRDRSIQESQVGRGV